MTKPEPNATPIRQAWLDLQDLHNGRALPKFCCAWSVFELVVKKLLAEPVQGEGARLDDNSPSELDIDPATHPSYKGCTVDEALRPPHECQCIARAPFMDDGRDWWVGKLTAPVPEWPLETHCLHLKTPLKDVVFLCNRGDFEALTLLAASFFGHAVNPSWVESLLPAYAAGAPPEPVPEGGARVPQDAFNHLSRLHGEARELARSYRDTACRTLDKAEIFARQGKPLPADEIAAMTARIVRDDKKLDGEGRPVKPHASGPAQVFPSPATEHAPKVKA